MSNQYLRRRWLDFRVGHSIYLIFLLTFINFVLIFHRLLIERVEVLNEVFSNLWLFGIVFILFYIPVGIFIGLWHRRTQLRVESDLTFRNYPLMAKSFRILVDLLEGKASKQEVENYRNFLKSIESGKGGLIKHDSKEDEETK